MAKSEERKFFRKTNLECLLESTKICQHGTTGGQVIENKYVFYFFDKPVENKYIGELVTSLLAKESTVNSPKFAIFNVRYVIETKRFDNNIKYPNFGRVWRNSTLLRLDAYYSPQQTDGEESE